MYTLHDMHLWDDFKQDISATRILKSFVLFCRFDHVFGAVAQDHGPKEDPDLSYSGPEKSPGISTSPDANATLMS